MSDMPVVGMIAAFEQEKGVDLLIETLDDMLNMYIRFVFLRRRDMLRMTCT